MRADNLPQLTALSAPAVHPEGAWVVVSAVRADFEADTYVGQLWRVPIGSGEPRRITRGFRDTAPAISPDGELIGFLRAPADGPAQLAIVAAQGGEPMILTDTKLGVREFQFSPDSSKIAYISAVPADGRYGTLDGVDGGHEDPRHITALQFQLNGVGYLSDQRPQVFEIEVPDPSGEPAVIPVGRAAGDGAVVSSMPRPRQLTDGDFDHQGLAWVGDSVVVISARHPGRDQDLRADLYRIEPDGAEPVRLTDSPTGVSVLASPVLIADQIFFIGIETGANGCDVAGANAGVYVVSAEGGVPRRVTDAETVCVEGVLVGDGAGVLAIDQVRGRGMVIRVDATGELERWALAGAAHSVGAGGGARIAALAAPASPCELVDLAAPSRPITDFGSRLTDSVFVPLEQVATAEDGYPVHGWVVRPDGEGPHPVVLLIHGGPFAAYSDAFFDEAQVLAEAGYAVLMCNPRGSAGYGQAHGRVLKGAMGDRDVVDVLAFLDHCLSEVPGLDAARVGVMGGSYGGYLTAWLISHTDRFAAAIVERAYLDGRSMIGAADIGWFFPFEYQGGLAEIDQRSPLYLVHQVHTPTLIIHSEQDLRCPISVAQRYYTELKLRGVETEMLVFPGENHELSRSGTPQHRLARFEHIVAWWNQRLC
jgi:dipeptidyl aminopeptidase/acylaminoacyl peptidase